MFIEKTAEEILAMDANELAGYHNELNTHKREEIQASIDAKASKEDVSALRKELNDMRDAQYEEQNVKLKEMGLELARFKKGDGKTKVALGDQVMKNLKENLENLKDVKAKSDKGRFDFHIDVNKAAGTMLESTHITGQLPVVEMIPGMNPIATRKVWIKALLKKGSVMGNTVAWVDQANQDGAAGVTTEGSTKNQIDFDLVVRTTSLVKYTNYIKISEEMLEDIDFMSSEVNNELLNQLDLAVDAALLVLIQASATAYAAGDFALAVATPTSVDALISAINQIEIAHFEPTVILMHPTDVNLMRVEKDANGNYIFPNYISANGLAVDGIPIVKNTGITKDNFLIMDSTKGTIYTKNKKRLEVGRDGNDFTKNLVTILAEERDLLVIKENHKPAFVKGVISTAKTAITLP